MHRSSIAVDGTLVFESSTVQLAVMQRIGSGVLINLDFTSPSLYTYLCLEFQYIPSSL